MINDIKVEDSIVKTDYLIWKNARSNDKGFHHHETSKCHQQAIKNLIEIPKFTKCVTTMFKTNTTETQRINRTSLLKIISCLLYLTCQELSFRGHGDEKDINFKQLIRFRAAKWLKEKNLSYTSPEIQNKILKDMSLSVLHDVVNCIKKSEFFLAYSQMNHLMYQTENKSLLVFSGWMKICILTKTISAYTKCKRWMQQWWSMLSKALFWGSD